MSSQPDATKERQSAGEPILTQFFEDGSSVTIYENGIKIDVGGSVHVRTAKEWHQASVQSFRSETRLPESMPDVHATLLDAERYRWLKANYVGADFEYADMKNDCFRCVLLFQMNPPSMRVSGDLDRTIDDARTA